MQTEKGKCADVVMNTHREDKKNAGENNKLTERRIVPSRFIQTNAAAIKRYTRKLSRDHEILISTFIFQP